MQDFLQHVINGLGQGGIYALIALGYSMAYGVLQMINFAHSEVYMMGAFAVYYGMGVGASAIGWRWTPGIAAFSAALAIATVCCGALAFVIERLAYRPLRAAPKLNVLITAIGVSLLLQNAAQIGFGANPRLFPTLLDDATLFSFGDVQARALDAAILAVSAIAMIGLRWWVRNTRFGAAMRAASANRDAAALMGIDVNRVISITFVCGGALAGIGATLVGAKYPSITPFMGLGLGMKAFVAAVLGGVGNLGGAMLGGMLMGMSEEFVSGYMPSSYRDAFAFGILIVVLLFKPAGLLGKMQTEKT